MSDSWRPEYSNPRWRSFFKPGLESNFRIYGLESNT